MLKKFFTWFFITFIVMNIIIVCFTIKIVSNYVDTFITLKNDFVNSYSYIKDTIDFIGEVVHNNETNEIVEVDNIDNVIDKEKIVDDKLIKQLVSIRNIDDCVNLIRPYIDDYIIKITPQLDDWLYEQISKKLEDWNTNLIHYNLKNNIVPNPE